MPVTFHWLAKDKIIYTHFSGVVTISEIKQVATESINLINSINSESPLIHGIVDNRDVIQFPQNTYQVNRALYKLLRHQRLGWIIYVTDMNPILKMLSSLVAQMAQTRYRSFSTPQDAIEFLQYVDTSLPDLPIVDWSSLPVILEIENINESNSTT